MDQWIRDLILQAVGPLRDAITSVFQRIAVIWSSIIAVGINLRNAYRYFVSAARHKLAQLRGLTNEAWVTMAWLIKIRLPQAIAVVADGIVQWTRRIVSDARNALDVAIRLTTEWANRRLNELHQFLNNLGTWIRDAIANIRETLTFVAHIVGALLTDPMHMAEWLFGALINKLLTFINDNAETLFDLLLQRGIYYAGKVANRLEEMLVRLL